MTAMAMLLNSARLARARPVVLNPLWMILLLTASLGGCNLFVDEASRISRAQNHYDRGDYRSAIIELKKTLQENSDNAQARALLGKVYLYNGDFSAAEKELNFALDKEQQVGDTTVRALLGKTLLSLGKYSQAADVLKVNPEQDGQQQVLLGYAALGQAQFDQAEAAMQTARDWSAANNDQTLEQSALIGLARIAFLQQQTAEAQQRVTQVLSANDRHVQALVLQAELHADRGENANTIETYNRLLQTIRDVADAGEAESLTEEFRLLPSEKFFVLMGLVDAYWQTDDQDAVTQTLARVVKQFPSHPRPRYLQALQAFQAGEYTQAASTLQEVLRSYPRYEPALILSGSVNFALDNFQQADMLLSTALAINPDNTRAQDLLTATRLKLYPSDEALNSLRSTLPSDADVSLLAGRVAMNLGETEQGLRYIQEALRKDPDNILLATQLASAYIANNQYSEAVDILESLPGQNSEADSNAEQRKNLLLVFAHLRSPTPEKAINPALAMAVNQPDDASVYRLLGTVYAASGDNEKALSSLQRATRLGPKEAVNWFALGEQQFRLDQLVSAEASLRKSLSLDTGNEQTLLTLSRLLRRSDQGAEAVKLLQQATKDNPGSMPLVLALVETSLQLDQLDQAEQIARDLYTKRPDQVGAVNSLAAVLAAQDKSAEAIKLLAEAEARKTTASVLPFNRAQLLAAAGQTEAADAAFKKALTIQPDNLTILEGYARFLASQQRTEAAFEVAKRLQQASASQAYRAHALQGDLFMRQGQYRDAVEQYTKSFDQRPAAEALLKMTAAKSRAGLPLSTARLNQWLTQYPRDNTVRLALAQYLQENGQNDAAIREYEQAMVLDESNYLAMNNLAWLYSLKQDKRALKTAARAHELAPDNPSIMDTYGWLLIKQGDLQQGLDLVEQAARLLPEQPDIQYHIAYAHYQLGQVDTARSRLQQLLQQYTQFYSRKDAEALFDELS